MISKLLSSTWYKGNKSSAIKSNVIKEWMTANDQLQEHVLQVRGEEKEERKKEM